MKLDDFIESGILTLYVKGQLPPHFVELVELLSELPEIRNEISRIEEVLEVKAMAEKKVCRTSFEEMQFLMLNSAKETEMVLSDLPLINKHSDYEKWQELIDKNVPEALIVDNFQKILRRENGVMQVLVVSSDDIPDELHTDSRESFLILKGECICTVGNHVFGLEAGGFTEIPLNENHHVEITQAPVMAIVQYVDP